MHDKSERSAQDVSRETSQQVENARYNLARLSAFRNHLGYSLTSVSESNIPAPLFDCRPTGIVNFIISSEAKRTVGDQVDSLITNKSSEEVSKVRD